MLPTCYSPENINDLLDAVNRGEISIETDRRGHQDFYYVPEEVEWGVSFG